MSTAKRFASVREITSVWTGSPEWSPLGATAWADRYDVGLHEAVSSEHPLIVASRNSNDGRAGAIAVAEDVHLAIALLAEKHGWKVDPLVPPKEFIADALMTRGMVVRSREPDGRPFINRFLALDLRSHGLVISLSAGSAKKLNEDFEQPYVKWLERLATGAGVEAGGFFFKRYDRAVREYWSQGTFLQRLRHLEASRPIWVADGLKGRWDLDPRQDIIRFVEGTGSSNEADGIVAKRLTSQRDLTGSRMDDYKVPYALHSACPPGTYRFQDPGTKRWFLAIDSPDLHPTADPIAGLPRGVPQVRLVTGELADQTATMQWLLSELGRPGKGLRELWPELIRRRYSTETLRLGEGQGSGAYYGGPSKPTTGISWDYVTSWSRSILNNLDFYETGTLARSISPDEEPIEIANCFPPAGRWADPADFDRIRRHLSTRRTATRCRTSWSWAGMSVTVNGVPGRFGTPRTVAGRPVQWPVVLEGSLPPEDPALRGGAFVPAVPDEALTSGIVKSLLAANGRLLLTAIGNQSLTEQDAAVANELNEVVMELGRSERRVARQQEDIYAEDPETGEAVMPSVMRIDAMRRIQRLQEEVEALRERRRDLTDQLDALRVSESGVSIEDLQVVLDGLHNPRTNAYRERLGQAVRSLDFQVCAIKRDRLHGRSVTFTGEIILDTTSGPHSVPFGGAYETGAAAEAMETRAEGLARLRAGDLPTSYPKGSREEVGVRLALTALGVRADGFALRRCEDERLLQLGMAALFPITAVEEGRSPVTTVGDLASDKAFADDFGDVALLAERMIAVYSSRRSPRWIEKDEAVMEVDVMISSISSSRRTSYTRKQLTNLRRRLDRDPHKATAWCWDEGRPVLTPCPHCRGMWRVPVRFHEVSGYLCLQCRLDVIGIHWPVRFDRYAARADVWRAAGAPLASADDDAAVTPPKRRTRRRRALAALDASARNAIVDEYMDRSIPVSQIMTTHNVSAETVSTLVKAAGVPTRYPATRRRWEDRE